MHRDLEGHFPEFWPEGNRFAGALAGITPVTWRFLTLPSAGCQSCPGRVRALCGPGVVHADDPPGAHVRGQITFSADQSGADQSGADTVVRSDVLMRANDPLYELAMPLGGHRKEDEFWAQTLTALGGRLGGAGQAARVQTRSVCVDPRRQWRKASKVWHNSVIRSVPQTVAAPFTGLARRLRRNG